MKKYIKIFMPVALAIIVGSLTFVFAQTNNSKIQQFPGGDGKGFRPPPPMMGGGLPPQVLEKLNLTDAQKEQIKTLQDASRENSKANFDKLRAFDDQLKTVLDGETFNEDQARQILSGKAQIMIELELARLKNDIAIKNILTTEQKAQLEQLKQERPDFRGGQRGPGMPPQN